MSQNTLKYFLPRNKRTNKNLRVSVRGTANQIGWMSFIIYETLKVKIDCIGLPVCCYTQKHNGNSHRFLFQSHTVNVKTFGLILGAIV